MTFSKLVNGIVDKASSLASSSSSSSSLNNDGDDLTLVVPSSLLWAAPLSALSSSPSRAGVTAVAKYNNGSSNNMLAILACSSSSTTSSSSTQMNQFKLLASKAVTKMTTGATGIIGEDEGYYGPLCQYRKGFADHLTPKAMMMSTIRVAIQQGTHIMVGFMTDQVEQDSKRLQMVDEGKITVRESEEQAQEWEKIEWEKRWKIFPQKFLTAFARYHATTLVLRLYEWTVAHWVTNQRMDMLTMDPFAASKTLAAKVDVKDHPMYAANRIAHTTFWANLLFTLSDYTVHQTLLCYAYYIYYQRKQQRRRTEGGSQPEGDDRAIVTSFVHRSGQLFASRGFALVCSAIGAGVGTIVRPGWGTLMMSSMGEGAATTIMDDGTVAAVAALNRSKDSSSSEL